MSLQNLPILVRLRRQKRPCVYQALLRGPPSMSTLSTRQYVLHPTSERPQGELVGGAFEKSNLRAIARFLASSVAVDSLRFSLLGGNARTPGPVDAISTFPSASSSAFSAVSCASVLGRADGCVGLGSAVKYGWNRACGLRY